MKIDVHDLKFYPTNNNSKIYHAVGYIDLYNANGKIEHTLTIDIPKCIYDVFNNELIGLETIEGDT